MSNAVDELLARNRLWAERSERADPDFFRRLEAQQRPRFLWIGCSDSRVPATQITDLAPGEMFVHRNVANVVSHDDANLLAVVEFALEALGVSDVILCGHYGCGGVASALDPGPHAHVATWLQPVAELAERHKDELALLPDRRRREERLAELNVKAQVEALCRLPTVHAAWRAGKPLAVHGWIYHVSDGRLHDLGVSRPVRQARGSGELVAEARGKENRGS